MSLRKGQTTIEFLVAFSVIMLLFTLLSMLLYQKFVQTNELKIDLAGKKLSRSLAETINEVYVAGDGFSQVIELPEKIAQSEYEVKFYLEEPTVFISTEKQSWSAPLFTPEVNCTLAGCSSSGGVTTLTVNSTLKVKIASSEKKIYLEKP